MSDVGVLAYTGFVRSVRLREFDFDFETDVYEGSVFPGFDEVDREVTRLWLDGEISAREWADSLYAAEAVYYHSLLFGGVEE